MVSARSSACSRCSSNHRKRELFKDELFAGLKRARASATSAPASSYRLVNGEGDADFVYYELNDRDYLFRPRPVLRDGTATFVDAAGATYHQFKNTFGALWRVTPDR